MSLPKDFEAGLKSEEDLYHHLSCWAIFFEFIRINWETALQINCANRNYAVENRFLEKNMKLPKCSDSDEEDFCTSGKLLLPICTFGKRMVPNSRGNEFLQSQKASFLLSERPTHASGRGKGMGKVTEVLSQNIF